MTKIDRNAKKVETDSGIFNYDILVVALGFETETFGINGMKTMLSKLKMLILPVILSRHIEDKFANYAASKRKMIMT